MFIEVILIFLILIMQYNIFIKTRKRIAELKRFFPSSMDGLSIAKVKVPTYSLIEPKILRQFLKNIPKDPQNEHSMDDNESVELIMIPDKMAQNHKGFSEVVDSTNAYLVKNKDASADFSILKDICERRVEKIDNEIGNLINVPLYLGLAGTFIGIIIGLWGIDFKPLQEMVKPNIDSIRSVGDTISSIATNNNDTVGALQAKNNSNEDVSRTIDTGSIQRLLYGVMAALFASLFGLVLTIINTSYGYRPAIYESDGDKNNYYDFLQRELLPVLNIGVARSLGNFKDVLNHFILKFGENMDDYKESGQRLNENLQMQQIVLQEINKLDLTMTSVKIAEVFKDLNNSSEHLKTFQKYQKGLNGYIDKTEKVVEDFDAIIRGFTEFNENLKAIGEYVRESMDLQRQFKESLEIHFPAIEDHRKIWRASVDDLNKDISAVYKDLSEYFKNSSEQVKRAIGKSGDYASVISELQGSLKVFVENSALLNDQHAVLAKSIVDMRNDFRETQGKSLENTIELANAIRQLNVTITAMNK
jgi:hypothetical protein